ncbi:MAG: M20 family metallopeptidase [Halobacteria archaeon]
MCKQDETEFDVNGTEFDENGSNDYRKAIDLLQDLVKIPSPYFEEDEIVEYVYRWLDERGLDPEYMEVTEKKITGYEGRNVLARSKGYNPEAPTLMLNAHMDTVKIVDDWSEDPFSARIEDGVMYGQGTCDMKGGLAAIMTAFEELAEKDLAGDVLLAAVVDEEGPYGLGANQLIRDGITEDVDACVVTEPGPVLAQRDIENPSLILGARGRFLYEIDVYGEAAHGSQPGNGVNAVVEAGKIAHALNKMDLGTHPELGDGSICPLYVEGGSETLSVPEHCRLLADRHVVLGEDPETVLKDAEEVIEDLELESRVEVGFREAPETDIHYGPYVTDPDHDIVDALKQGWCNVSGKEPNVGYFSSIGDFNYFGHRAETPTVILGPDGENIHSSGEYVKIKDVIDVTEVIVDAGEEYLS